jgi:pilus assembly protein Flp/PilA
MSKFAMTFRRFLQDESGATMVEYAIMVAVIAVAALGASQLLGGGVTNTFTESANVLN